MKSSARAQSRIGVLVPFTNTNLEPDMMLLCPKEVTLHFTRLGGYDADEIPDAGQMAGMGAADIEEALRLLAGAKPDVILYGCTSATLTHGVAFDQELAAYIKSVCGAETVTAAGALVHALQSLRIRRIAFASPYVAEINQQAIQFLTDAGFETVNQAEVEETLDNVGQGALTPEEVFELGMRADSPLAEVLVLSCTDMRAVEAIERLEKALNKPVITSNQAMVYQAMQLLDLGGHNE